MYKEKIKKWVGMLFVLAIYCTFSVNNVEAKNTCTAAKGKSYYKVKVNYTSDKKGVINKIKVSAEHGTFSIKIVPSTTKLSNKKIAKDDSIAAVATVKGGKTVTIPASAYSKYFDGKHKNLNIKIVAILEKNDKNDTKAPCDDEDTYIRSISLDSNNYDDSDITTVPSVTRTTSDGCKWVAANKDKFDEKMSELVSRALAPCLSETVSYNMSDETINDIANKLKSFWNTYKEYKEKHKDIDIVTQDIDRLKVDPPANGGSWTKVNSTDLSTKDDGKTIYETLKSRKADMLTCETKNEKTYMNLYYQKTYQHGVNLTLGDGTVTPRIQQNHNVCEVTCREYLTVSYGPPVAVVAGECFTYEVEVKSNTKCVSNIKKMQIPKFEDEYIPCDIRASCTNSSGSEVNGYNEQAGPSEEFDTCVNSCDGGKYTQECVDSCYQKTYENKEDKEIEKLNDASFNKVAAHAIDTLDMSLKNNKANKMAQKLDIGCPSDGASVAEVYTWANTKITGNYGFNNGVLQYKPKTGCTWSKYGYAYFRTKQSTARIVCNYQGHDWMSGSTSCAGDDHAGCYATAGCYPGVRRRYTGDVCISQNSNNECTEWAPDYTYDIHYKPIDGFQRSDVCTEDCKWVASNTSINGKKCNYIDREKAENDYKKNIDLILKTIQGCIEAAAELCKEGETTERTQYAMSANTDTKTTEQSCDATNYEDNKNCIAPEWRLDSNENNKNLTINKVEQGNMSDRPIIKYDGGSCRESKNEKDMYHAILSFPGAWINNKSGVIVTKEPSSEEKKYYTEKSYEYCTPFSAQNVNANWWTWNQYHKTGSINITFDQWDSADIKNIVYNIFGKIQNFGRYNWKINTGCFYAINNYSGDACIKDSDCSSGKCDAKTKTCVVEKDDPDCTSSHCPHPDDEDKETSSKIDNYSTKSITGTNLFPSSKTSSLTDKKAPVLKMSYANKMADSDKTRTEGFNWSVQATNLSIKGYPVTPSALVKKIQEKDTYTDDELDYSITLTSNQIKNIKEEAKRYSSNEKTYYTAYDYGGPTGLYAKVSNDAYKDKFGEKDTPSYTYYISKFIRNEAYSKLTLSPSNLACNNTLKGDCDLTLSGYVKTDQDLITWLNQVKN